MSAGHAIAINKKINYIDLEIALKMIPKGTAKIAKPVLKAFAKKMNLDSIFLVPYYLNDNLEGLITFDTCKDKVNKPTWTEESKQLIFEALDIVSNFIIQKRNEDALRESEERFRTIFETTPDLIFIKDLYQTYTHVNPAMAKQFDKSKEQLIGLNDDELFGFEVAKQTKEIDSKVLKGSIIKEDATELISGHDKVFDVVKVPMKNHRGKIIGLCGMARDVTKRKKAEDIQNVVYEISHAINTTKDLQELFKSIQDSLGKVVDTTNFYIALYHQENDTLTLPYMVDEKDRFTEFPVKDTITSLVIRKKKTLLVTEDEIIKLAKQEKIELAGTLPKVWLGVPLKSGKKVIGIIAVQSYTDASTYSKEHSDILELVSGSIATAIEKKRAEEARIRLETAINHTAEMIMITDNRGKIQYVNPAFVKVTGYTESDVIGKNPKILKSDKQDDYFYKHLWSTISSGNTWIGHFTNRTKSGKLYEEDSAISPIFDEAGEIINYVAVKRDVSEHLQLEMRLRQAEKMEAIGTLAGGIAHDFNNIIGAIIGYTELSMDDVKDEATIHNLKQIIKASHRAKDLVQQILAFSRQDEKERKPLQISLIVKEALKMLRASLPATIDIIPNIQDKAGLVLADPTHIHQVVMNLCLNSAHAMREKGGELEVSLKEVKIDNDSLKQYQELKAGPYIKLMVKDSGQGIDANIIDRIFEPYFTTKEVDEGSGMGLSLVHGIVKRYNGEITVFSEKNKGTTINVLLPKIFKKLNNHIEGKKPLKKGHEKILYIDDEQNLVEVGTQMLKRLGYKVFSTMSSLEALNMFESNPDIYDLVITDQTMPGMTGAELALKLMNIRSDIPIILCTGHSEVISEEKTKEMGIREFIMKPLFSEDLATVIRRVLDT
ncbi:hypothetical protein B6I21_00895 [candidate division KSB1 bacterium 4572_119]|nr:MAG: hypothetical protein B6I21_00895 [candidate division KSB1 bacterium 4572_119]